MAGIFGESETEKMLKQFMNMYGDVLSGKTSYSTLPEFKGMEQSVDLSTQGAIKEAYRQAGQKGLIGGGVNKMIQDILEKGFKAKGGLAGNIMQNLWGRTSETGTNIANAENDAFKAWLNYRLGRKKIKSDEDIARMGQISGSASSGMNMCGFIFTEGGRLTDNVRTLRDEKFPKGGVVENGYRRMARWLVPKMARNWFIKKVIQATMLNPICSIADHYYGYNSYGWVFRPIGYFWKKVWKRLGR